MKNVLRNETRLAMNNIPGGGDSGGMGNDTGGGGGNTGGDGGKF